MGLGIALGSFLKCLFNRDFAEAVKSMALKGSYRPKEAAQEISEKEEADSPVKMGDFELGAIQVLSDLQKKGRLIDFLEEDLSQYEDEDIGSSVRSIHDECKGVLSKILVKEKILDQEEESSVRVNKDHDIHSMKLSGRVSENFPLKGLLVHPGWRVKKVELSRRPEKAAEVLAPAEIEIQ